MNKETFEKKYTEVFKSLHLQLIIEEFKKDLDDMVKTEAWKEINKIFNIDD